MVVMLGLTTAPSDELRTLLDCGVALADEVRLRHADAPQRIAHGRPGAFAHADRTDGGRLHQGHLQTRPLRVTVVRSDHARGQPTGRPATDDHHALDLTAHPWALPSATSAILHPDEKAAGRQRLFHPIATRALGAPQVLFRYFPRWLRPPNL